MLLDGVTLTAVITAAAVIFLLAWTRLPNDARQPLLVYVGSYFLTYCIGGVWIGLTDGEVLTSYLGGSMYIPSIYSLGSTYWLLLLLPLIVPACVVALLTRRWWRPSRISSSSGPALSQFIALFVVLTSYAVVSLFQGGSGVLEAIQTIRTSQGDSATLVERRLELFGTASTIAFGILYSSMPALSHVALFKATHSGGAWRVVTFVAVIVTAVLLLATFQVAPALVFVSALTLSAIHLQWLRMTWVRWTVIGSVFLLLAQLLNTWKYGDWTLFENTRHLVFRMPAAYPYYLDYLPESEPFLGTDWVGALTALGSDPGAPFVVSRYMYPGTAEGGAMAAPAHVQGYAEGGVLNAMIGVVVVGLLVVGVALLRRKSSSGAIWHSLYMQGLVMLYYATQASFRGVIWHSFGLLWSLAPLLLLGLMSLQSSTVRAPQGASRVVRDRLGVRPLG